MVKPRYDILVAVFVASFFQLTIPSMLGGFLGTTLIYFLTIHRWEKFVKKQDPSYKQDKFSESIGFCMVASIFSDILAASVASQNVFLIVGSGALMYMSNAAASKWVATTWSGSKDAP